MTNELLINLVNSILGKGKRTSRGNVSYHCPFCNHHKPKLEINFTENQKGNHPWHCWVCNSSGKKIHTLFKKLEVDSNYYIELKKIVSSTPERHEVLSSTQEIRELPKEYLSFSSSDSPSLKKARKYLHSRGITDDDILRYQMGFCEGGEYADMVIIPSFDGDGKLNYFTSRSINKNSYRKYKNPSMSRDIIPFELFINWDLPIIICEGPFDAITIKRNAIPLLGKNIQPALLKKIIQSKVDKIYIVLDKDALNQALDFCEKFLNEGKEVYLVELEDKDPNEMGFENFTNLIQNVSPINQYEIMEKKIMAL